MAALCAFLCWQGSREYSALANLPTLHRVFMVAAGWLTLAGLLILGTSALAWTPALVFFLGAALSLCPVEGETEVGQRFGPMLATLWGYLYLGWLPAHLVALSMGKAPGLVLAVGLGVALSDVGAFCAGKALRGPKLAPRLSPNKTWGGVLGNFGGAALALALLLFALPALAWWQFGLLAATIATGSVWGDLLESLLKRQRGVKDAGALLPGFGGLLDRIDSLLLVVPLVYYLSLAIF
jgi:phosphatidate cytidylyltransferase